MKATNAIPLSILPHLLLASCSAPPKPPEVDESLKRPVNTPAAIELQVCRNDLQNTRLVAIESGRAADMAAATVANAAARQQLLAARQARQLARPNGVYVVRFEAGSAAVTVPAEVAPRLADEARAAPLVLLRGRTDGTSDAPKDARIARERSNAMRDWLVAAGVAPARIRTTWQTSGDPVADNATAEGRRLNRRVEIELYRALPVAASASGGGASAGIQP